MGLLVQMPVIDTMLLDGIQLALTQMIILNGQLRLVLVEKSILQVLSTQAKDRTAETLLYHGIGNTLRISN